MYSLILAAALTGAGEVQTPTFIHGVARPHARLGCIGCDRTIFGQPSVQLMPVMVPKMVPYSVQNVTHVRSRGLFGRPLWWPRVRSYQILRPATPDVVTSDSVEPPIE